MKNEVANTDKNLVKYDVGGEEVKLSPSIVNQFISRGNKALDNRELGNFIQLCKFRKLNPFLNEAYPIKFGNEPAQLIVGADAFKRKAEEHPQFKGYRAGVIVLRDKEVIELEGAFMLKTDVLVGGWCEVFRKDRDFPYVAKVSMSEYDKGKSTWKQIPCTMIRKVAVVQALREAFPSELGAMFSGEELGVDETKTMQQKAEEIRVEVEQDVKPVIDFEPAETTYNEPVTNETVIDVEEEEQFEPEF